jgi:hypothetical protein
MDVFVRLQMYFKNMDIFLIVLEMQFPDGGCNFIGLISNCRRIVLSEILTPNFHQNCVRNAVLRPWI